MRFASYTVLTGSEFHRITLSSTELVSIPYSREFDPATIVNFEFLQLERYSAKSSTLAGTSKSNDHSSLKRYVNIQAVILHDILYFFDTYVDLSPALIGSLIHHINLKFEFVYSNLIRKHPYCLCWLDVLKKPSISDIQALLRARLSNFHFNYSINVCDSTLKL